MGRTRRDCPVCNKKGLLRLPNHLRYMHNLDPQKVMASRAEPLSDDDETGDISDDASMDTSDSVDIIDN